MGSIYDRMRELKKDFDETKAGANGSTYDMMSELKAFDETKGGVKALVDAGVTEIPRIFIHDRDKKHWLDDKPISEKCFSNTKTIPIIDLQCVADKEADEKSSLRSDIVSEIRSASETWGLFQVINHGIPTRTLEEAVDGIRRFFEQDVEIKKKYYSRDYSTKVYYMSNYNLFEAPAAAWRDTLTCVMGRHFLNPEELPSACREIMITYNNQVLKLGFSLFQLLSEALGLEPNYLNEKGYGEGMIIASHYYPACPQPELTMGMRTHLDSGLITLHLQNQIGGHQIFHENQWFDVDPIPGALIVNLGCLMQVTSNDRFKSAYQRVLSKEEGPGISISSVFVTRSLRTYAPIKELLSEENPSLYPEIIAMDIAEHELSEAAQKLSFLEKIKLR